MKLYHSDIEASEVIESFNETETYNISMGLTEGEVFECADDAEEVIQWLDCAKDIGWTYKYQEIVELVKPSVDLEKIDKYFVWEALIN